MKNKQNAFEGILLFCLYLIAVPYNFIIKKVIPKFKRLYVPKYANRALSTLLVVAMMFSMVPFMGLTANASSYGTVIASGSCGKTGSHVVWTVYDSDSDRNADKLVIEGKGQMLDYASASFTPWYSYKPYLETLVIEEGITYIGMNTFYGYKGLAGTLTIPNSVTSIGAYAFYWCKGFTGNLTIPNSVTSIGVYAFYMCKGLTGNLAILDSVTNVGAYAFFGCSGFTGDLTIPSSVKSIGDSTFSGCSGFTGNLTLPGSVKSIGDSAFSGCSGFTGNLTLPGSVKSIGDSAFSGCSGFTGALTIPNSVTSIGASVFSGCSGFTGNLTMPNSVTSIGASAFSGCSGLTGDLTIPSSVTSIGASAFSGCSGFTGDLTIPSSVTSIGGSAFYNCAKLQNVYFVIDCNKELSLGSNCLYNGTLDKFEFIVNNESNRFKKITVDGTELNPNQNGNYVVQGIPQADMKIQVIYEQIVLETVTVSQETLSCTEIKLSATITPQTDSVNYQWYVNDENSTSGGTAINGATSSSFTISDNEYNGKYIYVQITGVGNVLGTVYGMTGNVINITGHNYVNGICQNASEDYQPAVLNGDTYEIGNAGQLMWFTDKVNAGEKTIKAKLTSDIDMNAVAWKGINEYGGTFDGQGYSINNLAKGLANEARNGFINNLTSSGVVKNVIFDGADIFFKRSNLGIIVGSNQGTISKCLVTNSYVQLGYYDNVGGIAGTNDGVITNCGVINTTIKRRYSGQGRTAGGISETNSGTISNCFTYNCNFVNASADSGAVIASGTAPTNCFYYTTSTVSSTFGTAKTQAEFNSGEVTYLLNGSTSEGNLIWGQTIGTDTAPIFWSDNTIYYDTEKNVYYNTALEEEIISVDITWGALEFTYTDASEGTWNPETHKFENATEGGWAVDRTDGDKVTVTTSSNVDVTAAFSYVQTNGSAVTGSFMDGENPITEPLPLAKGDEAPQTVVAYIKLSGKPEEAANKTTFGTITVTIGGVN